MSLLPLFSALLLNAFSLVSNAYPAYYDCVLSSNWAVGLPFGHMGIKTFGDPNVNVTENSNSLCKVFINGEPTNTSQVRVDPGSIVNVSVSSTSPSFLHGVSASTGAGTAGKFVGKNPSKNPSSKNCSYAYNKDPPVPLSEYQLQVPSNAPACLAIAVRAACGDHFEIQAAKQIILLVDSKSSGETDALSCQGYAELASSPPAFLGRDEARAAFASLSATSPAAVATGQSPTEQRRRMAFLAHSFLMLLAFGLLFPLGASTAVAKPKRSKAETTKANPGTQGGTESECESGIVNANGKASEDANGNANENVSCSRRAGSKAEREREGVGRGLATWLREQGTWFRFHMALQIVASAGLIGGFISSFYMPPVVGTFNSEEDSHPIIGCFLLAGVGTQVILGFLRPSKTKTKTSTAGGTTSSSSFRTVWEWVHKVLGWVIVLVGIGNCCLGIQWASEIPLYSPEVPALIGGLSAFIIPALFVLLLEVFGAWKQLDAKVVVET